MFMASQPVVFGDDMAFEHGVDASLDSEVMSLPQARFRFTPIANGTASSTSRLAMIPQTRAPRFRDRNNITLLWTTSQTHWRTATWVRMDLTIFSLHTFGGQGRRDRQNGSSRRWMSDSPRLQNFLQHRLKKIRRRHPVLRDTR